MKNSAYVTLFLMACSGGYSPKPKGYNRLDLPTASYRPSPDTLPYLFEYSTHAILQRYQSRIAERYWIELVYPSLQTKIHITYKSLDHNSKKMKELLNDAYTLTSKQQIKAYAIDEVTSVTPKGNTVFIAEIVGEVPTQMQFTITDSTQHFLRGALYFDAHVQNDSLAPAIDFMKKEVLHLINTLEWKKKK